MKWMLKFISCFLLIPVVPSTIIHFFGIIDKPWIDIYIYCYGIEFILLCIGTYLIMCEEVIGTPIIPNDIVTCPPLFTHQT